MPRPDLKNILLVAASVVCVGTLVWTAGAVSDRFLVNGPFLDRFILKIPPGVILFRAVMSLLFAALAAAAVSALSRTRRAERMSEEAREKLDATLKAVPAIMFEVDRDGVIYGYQAPRHELLYADPGIFLGKKVSEALPDNAAKVILKAIEQAVKSGCHRGASYFLEIKGEKKWFELSITAKNGTTAKDTRLLAVVQDITDRKKAAEALSATNSLLSSTVEASFNGILVVDLAGKVRRFNRRFAEMWRIPGPILATADDKKFLSCVVGQLKDPEGFLKGVESLYGRPEAESYDIIEFKDGRVFDRLSGPQRVGEEIVGRVWTFRDVTEQKKAEDGVKAALSEWESTFDACSDSIMYLDTEYRVMNANLAAAKMLGTDKKEMIGRRCFELMHGTPLPPDFCPLSRVVESRKREQAEVRLPGEAFAWLLVTVDPVFGEKGEIRNFVHIARDITEHKRAERMLEEGQRKMSTLVGNLKGMVYRCLNDRHWTMEFVSEGCLELTGYKATDVIGNVVISYNEVIHPGDRERVWDEVQDALGRRAPFEIFYRIVTAGGEEKKVWERGCGVFSGEKLVALEGFITDLGEHRKAEEKGNSL